MEDLDIVIIFVYACDTIPKYKQQILKINQVYNDLLHLLSFKTPVLYSFFVKNYIKIFFNNILKK